MKQNRARLQLRQLIREVLAEDKKVKIYVQKGKKPPKGKSLKKGPRGGSYFVGSPGEKQTYEKGGASPSASKPASKPKVNIFDKPTKKKPVKKAVKTSTLKVPKEYETDNTYTMANHVADNFAKLVDRKTLPKNWEYDGLDKNNVKRIEKYLKSVFKPGSENEEFDDQFLENFWDDFGSVDTQAMPSSGITTVSGGQAMPGSGKTIVSKTQDRDWFGDKKKKFKVGTPSDDELDAAEQEMGFGQKTGTPSDDELDAAEQEMGFGPKLPKSIKKNLMPAGEYMDGIIDVEEDNFEDSPEDSLLSDYKNVKNYITKKWPNAKMLSGEDEGGEDVSDFEWDVQSSEPVSEKKFGENLTITDYGKYAIFLYNDVGGSMTTLIAK